MPSRHFGTIPLADGTASHPLRADATVNPNSLGITLAKIVLLGDTGYKKDNGWSERYYWMSSSTDTWQGNDLYASACRHGRKGNVALLDGHVETLSFNGLSPYITISAYNGL